MLSFFRRGITSKLMLVVLGIGLFAIVATGFGVGGGGLGGMGGAGSGGTVASVGGEELTVTELTEQVGRQVDSARQQQPELDIGTFLASGAFEEIVRQLVTAKALVAFADEVGVGASKRMIDGEIASIPAFQNLAGQFDQATFQRAIQSERITEERLREEIAAGLIQRQLLLPVAGSPRVPATLAAQYATLLLETRTGSIAFVPAAAFAAASQPTDAEVAIFYRTNQARYTIPERRVLRYAGFGPEQVAAAARPTEAEVQAFYRANMASYGPSETRTLSQVVLPEEAAARAFAAKLTAGTSFEAAAQEAGFGAGDIAVGQRTRQAFAEQASEAVAAAAFAAQRGAVTAPARSPFGWHVVRVDAVNSTPARPLAAVRAEIERQLGQQKSQDALADLVTRIEEKVADGSSFDEVVREEKLTVTQTPPVTSAGTVVGATTPPSAELGPLLKAGFDMGADEDPVVETIVPNQRFALLAVGQIVPAAPAPFAQIRDQVRSDLVRQRALARARTIAAGINTKLNAGRLLAQTITEAGVRLPPVQQGTVRRMDLSRQGQEIPAPLRMMFSLPKGKSRMVEAPDGAGWFIVHLTNIVPGDLKTAPGLAETTRTQFARFAGDEYAEQFSRAIERQMKVERDQEAIARVKNDLRRGAVR